MQTTFAGLKGISASTTLAISTSVVVYWQSGRAIVATNY
jgi:hypothetical protein